MATLTKRQKEIFKYITKYIKRYGVAPTFKEIKNNFNLSALSTVHQHVNTLSEKGFFK